ncbi:MAG: RNA polymerase sigma factor [Bacteroidota bacterium]
MGYMPNTDHDIVRRIVAGEQKAYADLVDRHKDRAMTLAVRMLKNRSEAEEALQDSFVRAFRALPAFEWKSSFSTWFYRIVFNVCSSRLSGRKNPTTVSIDDDDELKRIEVPSEDEAVDVHFEMLEFTGIVRQEIEKMDEAYSAILTLFYVQEMSYEEIGSVTGLPLGTVKNRLFRARTLLRSAVLKHFSEHEYSEKE